MNRYVYYGHPQANAPFLAPQYIRNEAMNHKETPAPTNVTLVEPKFTEHLRQHKGLKVAITTTVGKLVGTLEDVFVDHVALVVDGKLHHIRLGEIVYFEKVEEKK
jgi:hypothetical protein